MRTAADVSAPARSSFAGPRAPRIAGSPRGEAAEKFFDGRPGSFDGVPQTRRDRRIEEDAEVFGEAVCITGVTETWGATPESRPSTLSRYNNKAIMFESRIPTLPASIPGYRAQR